MKTAIHNLKTNPFDLINYKLLVYSAFSCRERERERETRRSNTYNKRTRARKYNNYFSNYKNSLLFSYKCRYKKEFISVRSGLCPSTSNGLYVIAALILNTSESFHNKFYIFSEFTNRYIN